MIPTYGNAAARLMADHVKPGQFGGFLTCDGTTRTETLFAVDRDTGRALQRCDRIGCREFDGPGWEPCQTVPDHAEWIGNYPAPKARAVLNGTRIVTRGQIGGEL